MLAEITLIMYVRTYWNFKGAIINETQLQMEIDIFAEVKMRVCGERLERRNV